MTRSTSSNSNSNSNSNNRVVTLAAWAAVAVGLAAILWVAHRVWEVLLLLADLP